MKKMIIWLLCFAMAFSLICMAGCNVQMPNATTEDSPLGTIPEETTPTAEEKPTETTAQQPAEGTTYPPATVPTQGTTYPPATVPTQKTTYPNATVPSFTNGTTATTQTSVTTAETVITETTTQAPIVVPPVSGSIDFGGRTFTIVCASEDALWGTTTKEIYGDDGTDTVSAAVRERNREIEALYNCKIEYVLFWDPGYFVATSVAVNRGDCDLFADTVYNRTRTCGNAYNLYSLGLDFDASYWDQSYIEAYTIDVWPKGKALYSITGALSMEPMLTANVLFYNKDVFAAKFPNVNLESMIASGDWTMDTFVNFVKEGGIDKNGNGYVEGEGDVVGFLRYRQSDTMAYLFYGAGVPIISNVNDEMRFMYDIPAVSTAIDKAIEVYSAGYWLMANPDNHKVMMENDEALFLASTMKTLDEYKVEGNIGVLPYPKVMQAQEDYAVLAERYMYVYSVPGDISDIQQAGDFLEVYASHSEKTVMPAFYELYGARYGSEDMLRLIEDSLVFDPAYQYWYGDIASPLFEQALKSKNTTEMFADKVAPRFQEFYTKLRQSIIDADK